LEFQKTKKEEQIIHHSLDENFGQQKLVHCQYERIHDMHDSFSAFSDALVMLLMQSLLADAGSKN